MASYNVISNTVVTIVFIASGMGTASTTLVGQALGRGDIKDAKRWGWKWAESDR